MLFIGTRFSNLYTLRGYQCTCRLKLLPFWCVSCICLPLWCVSYIYSTTMVNMVPQTVFGRPLHMQAHDACQQQMYAQAAYGQQTQSPYGQPLYFPENADIVDLVLHAPQQAPAQGERQHARARAHTHTHTHTHVVAEETLYMRGIHMYICMYVFMYIYIYIYGNCDLSYTKQKKFF